MLGENLKMEILSENVYSITSKDYAKLSANIQTLSLEIKSQELSLNSLISGLTIDLLDYEYLNEEKKQEDLRIQSFVKSNVNMSFLKSIYQIKHSSNLISNLVSMLNSIINHNKSFYSANDLDSSNIYFNDNFQELAEFLSNNYSEIEVPSTRFHDSLHYITNHVELRLVFGKINRHLLNLFELVLYMVRNTFKKRVIQKFFQENRRKYSEIQEIKEGISSKKGLLEDSRVVQEEYKASLCQLVKQKVNQNKRFEVNQKIFLKEEKQSAISDSKQDIISKFFISQRYLVKLFDNRKDDQCSLTAESTESKDYVIINLKSQYINSTQFLNSFRKENHLTNDSSLTKSTLTSDTQTNLIIVKSEAVKKLARTLAVSNSFAIEHPSEFLISKAVSEYSSFFTDANNQDLISRKDDLGRFLFNSGLKDSDHSSLKLEKASTKISSFVSSIN